LNSVIWNDLVVLGGEGKATYALRIARGQTGLEKKLAWKNDDLRSYMVTSVVWKGLVIGINEQRQQLGAVYLENGNTAWIRDDFAEYASLILVRDHLLALKKEGNLAVFKLTTNEAALVGQWQISEKGQTWAYPALANGKLYIKDVDTLYCFELPAEKKGR
jgi:outer membrane protein assembly factor BamB